MCNLYSLTKGQAAICDWFRAKRISNLPLFPSIFYDLMAPIVRISAERPPTSPYQIIGVSMPQR